MTNCYSTTRTLPFLNDLPSKDRQVAEKALSQQEERRRKALETRGRKADQVAEEFRRRMSDLLGARKTAELRGELVRERLAFRDLWQPPEGLNRDYATERKASSRRIDALIRKLGPKAEKLRRIGRESQERLEGILSAADGKVVPGYNLPKNLDKWMSFSTLHKFPLPWGTLAPVDDPTDPHRWFLFRPPFFGFFFSFAPQATSNFRVDRQLFLNPSVGLVGNEATMDCDDAGDFDAASATAEAQIAVGFIPPVTGLVEVLIDAQSTVSTHHLDIDDEFGFSNAWAHQTNYLLMDVLHPNVPAASLAEMSALHADTDGDDVHVNRENLTRGQHYFAHLFSSGPVPAGQTVIVSVGTRSFDIARANDMELHSRSNFQWFINSLEVRIAP